MKTFNMAFKVFVVLLALVLLLLLYMRGASVDAQSFLGALTIASILLLPLSFVLSYVLRIILAALKEAESGQSDPQLENSSGRYSGTEALTLLISGLAYGAIVIIFVIPALKTLLVD